MSLNNKRYALLASVPIEYLTRLDSAIRQSTTWSQGAEHRAIRDKILELCDSCKQYIFQESALFRSIYAGAPITPSQEIVLRQILRTTSGAFTTLHELLLFLPRESIRRELTDYCRSLFNKEYNSSQISLLLTSLFNAFEYSLDDVMQFLEADVFKFKIPDPKSLPFGNVMELAIVDRNNPLAWAVLAHEFGHYLDNQAKITESATAEFTKKFIQQPLPEGFVATCEKLCKEMVADLTGYYLLGPCSILPLVNMSLLMGCLMESPIKFDGEHGAPTTRIRLIKAMCVEDEIDTSQIDFLLDALVEEEQEKQLRLNADEQKHRETIDSLLQSFFNDVRPVILTELQRRKFKQFTGTQYKRAQELAKNLANGLPIGACRAHPEEEAIKQLLAPDIKNMEAVRSKYYLLTENAVDVSEVITAGWIEHIDTLNKILDRAFSKSTATDAFDTIAADLEELDRLVLKSIDTISMLETYHAAAG